MRTSFSTSYVRSWTGPRSTTMGMNDSYGVQTRLYPLRLLRPLLPAHQWHRVSSFSPQSPLDPSDAPAKDLLPVGLPWLDRPDTSLRRPLRQWTVAGPHQNRPQPRHLNSLTSAAPTRTTPVGLHDTSIHQLDGRYDCDDADSTCSELEMLCTDDDMDAPLRWAESQSALPRACHLDDIHGDGAAGLADFLTRPISPATLEISRSSIRRCRTVMTMVTRMRTIS